MLSCGDEKKPNCEESSLSKRSRSGSSGCEWKSLPDLSDNDKKKRDGAFSLCAVLPLIHLIYLFDRRQAELARLEVIRLQQERVAREEQARIEKIVRDEQERFARLEAERLARLARQEEERRVEAARLYAPIPMLPHVIALRRVIEEARIEALRIEQEQLSREAELRRQEEERLQRLEQERLAREAELRRQEEERQRRLEEERLAREAEERYGLLACRVVTCDSDGLLKRRVWKPSELSRSDWRESWRSKDKKKSAS